MKTESTARAARAARVSTIASVGCIALSTAASLGTPEVAHAAGSLSAPVAGQLFGVHPVQQGSTTLPGGHFNFSLVAGQSITDGIVVENLSNHALHFHVYAADLLTAVGGGLAPAQPTATMHEVGAWITVSTPTPAIAAHGQFTDMFTVRVPTVVTPGQHLGAVVVAADVGTTSQGSPIEARAALITVVTVPGVAHASARLTPLTSAAAESGQMRFGITLFNTGNVLLTYAGSLDVTGDDGHHVATIALLPASSYVVPDGQVPLAALWNEAGLGSGRYRAQASVVILADGKVVGTLSSQFLTLQLGSGIPAPALVAGVLALVIVLLLATWSVRRRIRRRRSVSQRERRVALRTLRGTR